jgi:tRNA/rRNA methyltransferase
MPADMTVHFVLVEPIVPENVGASARAIKTMGFTSLRLVKPCDHLSPRARTLAHASTEILENARVFDSLEEAVSDCGLIVATTAKKRAHKGDIYPVEILADTIAEKRGTVAHVAIVFGREDRGLSNDELGLCDIAAHISMRRKYPSLNLSQAVMLFAHRLSPLNLQPPKPKTAEAPVGEFRVLKEKTARLLKEMGFREHVAIYPRILERLSSLKAGDVHLLLSVCTLLEKTLAECRETGEQQQPPE